MRSKLFVILIAQFLISCENNIVNKIVFLGDSITIGWDTELFFPMANTYNMGVNGSRIEYITTLNRDFSEFTSVVIMMGTNNVDKALSSEPMIEAHLDKFINNYKQVIENIHAQKIIVISILPQFSADKVESTLINNQIDLMNKKLAMLTCNYPNTKFVDVNSSFKDKTGELDMNYSTDGVHLNVFGYRLLSKQVIIKN